MKIIYTTTYIGACGEIERVVREEEVFEYDVGLRATRQIADVKKIGEGYKITVTRFEP